jgi:hypothetical protein
MKMTKKIPNLDTLLDEIKEAEKAAEKTGFMTYAHGYEDGLRMALDILEGRVE